MPRHENFNQNLPLMLDEWEEIIGVLRDVTERQGSLSVDIFIDSSNRIVRVFLPGNSFHAESIKLSDRIGAKIGILRESKQSESYRIRLIGGDKNGKDKWKT